MTRKEREDVHKHMATLTAGGNTVTIYGFIPRKEEPVRVYRTLNVKLRDRVWTQ